jgi:hypothetical protein
MTMEQCGIPGHTASAHVCGYKRISWTAILVGAFVGIGLGFLLNLFSIAIGLSIVTTTKEGLVSLAIGGFVGLLIGAIASMFVAGFAAGYLGRPYCIKRNLGALYGFTTWCVALILTVLLTAHMGRYVNYYSNFASNPVVVTNDNVTPAVSASTTHTDTAVVTVNAQKTTNDIGIGTFLIFILFFVGALSACFGGHCAMTCKRSCDTDNKPPVI